MNENLRPLSPFQEFCVKFLGYVPSSYDDCMTYLECLIYTYNYLKNEIVPTVNQQNAVVQELKNYVEHYFDNLDVQEEINNKLDQMAEQGELEEIIASYLNTNCILSYNTLNDMKNAENLVDGSTCVILGRNSYNDSLTALYKIRTITSGDVVDNNNIVALTNSNTLIAEKIKTRNKMIIIGDSWSMNNYPYIENQDNMWFNQLAKRLNLDVTSYAVSGAGYNVTNNRFRTQVASVIANENPNEVKKIIVFGGLNDQGTYTNNAIYSECSYILGQLKTAFPDSEIIVIGVNTIHNAFTGTIELMKTEISEATYANSCMFIDSIPFLLGYATLFGENTNNHPNENGQKFLGGCIYSSICGNYKRNVVTTDSPYTVTKAQSWYPDLTIKTMYKNDCVRLNISINITTQFGSSTTLTYTMSALNFSKSDNSLFMKPQYDNELLPALINKTSTVTNFNIVVPGSVTGIWEGYIDIPY